MSQYSGGVDGDNGLEGEYEPSKGIWVSEPQIVVVPKDKTLKGAMNAVAVEDYLRADGLNYTVNIDEAA